ncbi:4Fe-4S binding protein [Chloroflexota bacterium]
MVLRQRIRLSLLFLIVITFPVTLNYFSVYLIIEGSAKGIITTSFFFWTLFAGTSLVFGRAACGYICPLGAYQETKDRMVPKPLARIKYLQFIKYLFAIAWVGAIVYFAAAAGGYHEVNLLYNTESGVSVDSPQSWFTFATIILVVLAPVFFIGKRGFCHYFCPWGVLNTLGTRVKDFFRWPSLHLKADSKKCKKCHTCDRNCPMSLPVNSMVQAGSMKNTECILCGTCADTCPNEVIEYSWRKPNR